MQPTNQVSILIKQPRVASPGKKRLAGKVCFRVEGIQCDAELDGQFFEGFAT